MSQNAYVTRQVTTDKLERTLNELADGREILLTKHMGGREWMVIAVNSRYRAAYAVKKTLTADLEKTLNEYIDWEDVEVTYLGGNDWVVVAVKPYAEA